MNKAYVFVGAVVAAVSVYANVWDPVLLKGRTDKANPVDYKRGEPIVFTLYSENIAADAVPAAVTRATTRATTAKILPSRGCRSRAARRRSS